MSTIKTVQIILLALLLGAASAGAGSIVEQYDWNVAGNGTMGWTTPDAWVTVSRAAAGGIGNSGYLNISLADAGGDPGKYSALASVPAANLFAGAWNGDMWVEFDFLADDISPTYVQVRLGDDDLGEVYVATVYNSDFDPAMTLDAWTHLISPKFETFVNDLAAIDWIGVYIWRNTEDPQDYGLENFGLYAFLIPEPGQITMLAAALMTSACSLRRKFRKQGKC